MKNYETPVTECMCILFKGGILAGSEVSADGLPTMTVDDTESWI